MAPTVTQYTWNAALGRFVGLGNRIVSFAQVRADLDGAIRNSAAEASELGELLSLGIFSVADFQREMQLLIKDTQIYAAAVASGGFSNMSADDLATLTTNVTSQFAYLDRWIADLRSGAIRQTSGQAMSRAAMYAKAARGTYDDVFTAAQAERGYDEERNILHPGEHCDDCVAMSDLGWVPLGTLIPIGRRQCLTHCNCEREIRFSRAAGRGVA